MKYYFLPFFIVFSLNVTSVFCQDNTRQLFDRNNGNLMYLFQHEEVEGNAFLYDKFIVSDVYDENGDIFKNVLLKFDTYSNVFSYVKNDTTFRLPESIVKVVMHLDASKDMMFKKFTIASLNFKDKFFQVLGEGGITILKLYKKEIEEYTEYNNAAKLKRFKKGEVFLLKSDADFSIVSINKLKLDALMQTKWPQVEAYIKQNKLSTKDENDLSKVLAFYNAL